MDGQDTDRHGEKKGEGEKASKRRRKQILVPRLDEDEEPMMEEPSLAPSALRRAMKEESTPGPSAERQSRGRRRRDDTSFRRDRSRSPERQPRKRPRLTQLTLDGRGQLRPPAHGILDLSPQSALHGSVKEESIKDEIKDVKEDHPLNPMTANDDLKEEHHFKVDLLDHAVSR